MSRPRQADEAGPRIAHTWLSLFCSCALSGLSGCGTASLASWAGLDSAQREHTEAWTRIENPPPPAPEDAAAVLPVVGELEGRFTLLTYNVAGLPQALSPSSPRDNIPLMSPLFDAYDVSVMQEDFSYHELLFQAVHHRFRAQPMQPLSLVGDGLSQLSRLAFDGVHRVRWQRCNGFISSAADCLADKGFTFSRLDVGGDQVLHLYNLHADAGAGPLDIETRAHNFAQLAAYIQRRSAGQAVVVAGDTNLMTSNADDAETLARFLEALELRDACRVLGCWPVEPIDRVLYRGSSRVALTVTRLWLDTRFVDATGSPLSDHPAIGAELHWRRLTPTTFMAGLAPP